MSTPDIFQDLPVIRIPSDNILNGGFTANGSWFLNAVKHPNLTQLGIYNEYEEIVQQYLYIVNDQEPKPGDYCLLEGKELIQIAEIQHGRKGKVAFHRSPLLSSRNKGLFVSSLSLCQKVIASSNCIVTDSAYIDYEFYLTFGIGRPEDYPSTTKKQCIDPGFVVPGLPHYFMEHYANDQGITQVEAFPSYSNGYPYLIDQNYNIVLHYERL